MSARSCESGPSTAILTLLPLSLIFKVLPLASAPQDSIILIVTREPRSGTAPPIVRSNLQRTATAEVLSGAGGHVTTAFLIAFSAITVLASLLKHKNRSRQAYLLKRVINIEKMP